MKKLTTLLLSCLLMFGFAKAQYVNIPDSNFAKYLITQIPTCLYKDSNNLYWIDTTCNGVLNTKFMIMHNSIRDLKGIEYFKNLTDLYCYNNLLTNLSNLPNSITYLDCSNNLLTNLSSLPSSLTYLDCKLNQLTNLPTLPNSLLNLECSQNQLTSLPSLPNNLYTIDCSKNNLINLPNLPDSLHELYCLNNNLTGLPTLPAFLQLLFCDSNKLISLPNLPNTIQNIQVNSNRLTSLPTLPNSLIKLSCSSNHFINLPTLSPNLTILFCSNNQLSSFPTIPNSLTQLYIDNNQLSSLPSLPSSLQGLSIANNHFTVLPNLPTSLQELNCSNNPLRSLPSLPSSLQGLSCNNNMLNNLPVIPSLLNSLSCSNNQLNSLPVLPNSLKYLICYSNPYLFCLPKLPTTLKQLVIDSSKIHCISNTVYTVYDSVGNLLNMPICNSSNNPNGCTLNGLPSNLVNIPDSNFAKLLITKIPYCLYKDSSNQYWMDTTCAGVKNMNVLYCNSGGLLFTQNIQDITGIEYFTNLQSLNCVGTQLQFIDMLPPNLDSLIVYDNKITYINSLPSTLKTFVAQYNQLTSLPTIPAGLNVLIVDHNPLTSIPNLKNYPIGYFDVDNTLISSIPAFPDSATFVLVYGTPNLHCLPVLPNNMGSLYMDSSTVKCLPNKPSGFVIKDSNGNNLVLPVCDSAYNPNGCSVIPANYVNIPDSNFRKYLISLNIVDQHGSSPFNAAGQMDTTNTGVKIMPGMMCDSRNIYNLDGLQYFKNLVLFSCRNNYITSLSMLPSTVGTLTCENNLLTSMPYSPKLSDLTCDNNQISFVGILPNSLRWLSCNNNLITNISALPNNMLTLGCTNNKLTSLPTLPNSLQQLYCGKNKITNLPTLPNSLGRLNCDNNQLNSLPTLPNSLVYLSCIKTNLVGLQTLPVSLRELDCDSNQLSSLPILPDTLNILHCTGNSNLKCLPKLPGSLYTLAIDKNNIHCLPNFISTLTVTNTGLDTINLPICNPTNNANQCQPFPIVHGKVFTDDNNNGIKDGNEYYRPYVQLNASNGTTIVTNANGEYSLALTDTGTYNLMAIAPVGFKAVPASSTFTFTNNATSLTLPDIALQPINTNDSLTTFIMPLLWAKPGRELQYAISYENVGTVYASDTVKIVYDTAHLIFDSCSMPIISHTGNTIIAMNAVLNPGVFNYFYAYFTIKQSAVMGDSIFATSTISSPNTSATYATYQNVVSSYDPNYKDATPELSPVQVQNGAFIDYSIHFQNTGNDTAYNVVLADTLSALLKNNILQVVATSHPCNVTMKDSIIYFEFLNINLPDSTINKFRSNGFVHFRLLPQTNVPLGSRINNKASIYFDYNKPVVTNTASTWIKPYGVPVIIRNYSVTAERTGDNQEVVVINKWSVSTEINIANYTIQRSINNRDFNTAGIVNANGLGEYFFTDNPSAGAKVLYYRLKISDKDGHMSYSDVKQIIIQPKKLEVTIYPNPAKNFIMVKGERVKQINIIDNTGRVVLGKTGLNALVAENKVNINLADGVYVLQVKMVDGSVVNDKLIIKN